MVEQPQQHRCADGPSAVPPAESRGVGERFQDQFQTLLPLLQRYWPQIGVEQLAATRGNLDDVAHLIATHTSRAQATIREHLLELLTHAEQQTRDWGEALHPLEERLESILKDINTNLRPQLGRTVHRYPLLSLAMAAGLGLLVGLLIKPNHHR